MRLGGRRRRRSRPRSMFATRGGHPDTRASARSSDALLLPEEYRLRRTAERDARNRFWNAHFGGDPAVIGRTLQVGAERRTIVGVLPAGGRSLSCRRRRRLDAADIPAVVISEPARIDRARGDRPAARAMRRWRRPQAEMSTIAARLAAAYPDTNRDRARSPRRTAGRDGRPDQADDAAARAVDRRCCWRSPARTSPTCCWRRRMRGRSSSASAARSVRRRADWRGSCGRRSLALFAVAGTVGVALARPLASCAGLPLSRNAAARRRRDDSTAACWPIAAACTLAAALLAGLPRTRRLRDRTPARICAPTGEAASPESTAG